jgi:hypothetical protein
MDRWNRWVGGWEETRTEDEGRGTRRQDLGIRTTPLPMAKKRNAQEWVGVHKRRWDLAFVSIFLVKGMSWDLALRVPHRHPTMTPN